MKNERALVVPNEPVGDDLRDAPGVIVFPSVWPGLSDLRGTGATLAMKISLVSRPLRPCRADFAAVHPLQEMARTRKLLRILQDIEQMVRSRGQKQRMRIRPGEVGWFGLGVLLGGISTLAALSFLI